MKKSRKKLKEYDWTYSVCENCGIGVYRELHFHDDMDKILHCDECGDTIDRYRTLKPKKSKE